jgi:hypothetical protein
MESKKEIERVDAIIDKLQIIYGLENVNPVLVAILDSVVLDVEWLTDRLHSMWSLVEMYQTAIGDKNA